MPSHNSKSMQTKKLKFTGRRLRKQMLNTRLSKRRERLRSLRGRILVAAGNKEVGEEQIMVTKEDP